MANSSPICVDASIVVRLLTGTATDADAQLRNRWRRQGARMVAPTLLRYEVTNALHRYRRAGELSDGEVDVRLQVLFDLPFGYFADDELHVEAHRIAARFALPAAYDAHYLALAARLDAELWTADRRLARAVAGSLPWVNLVEG